MGRAYGDDLRRKMLFAYDQGLGTLEQLAGRFLVRAGGAKKISAQRKRTGQAERIPYQPGRKPHAGAEAQQQVRAWFVAQPDLTLVEVQRKLFCEAGVRLSVAQVAALAGAGSGRSCCARQRRHRAAHHGWPRDPFAARHHAHLRTPDSLPTTVHDPPQPAQFRSGI